MEYYVMHRAKNAGSGWRLFHVEPVLAASPEQACSQFVPDDDVLWQLRHHGVESQPYRLRCGTPEKPFTYCGGASEICAIPATGDTCEESERHYYAAQAALALLQAQAVTLSCRDDAVTIQTDNVEDAACILTWLESLGGKSTEAKP